MLKPVCTVDPTDTPVTLSELKAHLHIDHSDDDTKLEQLLEGAIAELDGYGGALGRAIMAQTWRVDFAEFSDKMRLPLGDLSEVVSVQYYDTNNSLQTASTALYDASQDEIGPVVSLKYNQQWPGTYSRIDAVRVTWICVLPARLLGPVKAAILLKVQKLYDPLEPPQLDAIERSINALLSPIRLIPT